MYFIGASLLQGLKYGKITYKTKKTHRPTHGGDISYLSIFMVTPSN